MTESKYGSRSEVKNQVGIDSTDTRFDDDIDNYLCKASRYMDTYLAEYGSVPRTTDDTLDDIANDLAAGMYRQDQAGMRGEQVLTDASYKRGIDALQRYVKTKEGLADEYGGQRQYYGGVYVTNQH